MLFRLASSIRKVWVGDRIRICVTESIGHFSPVGAPAALRGCGVPVAIRGFGWVSGENSRGN